MGATGEIGAIRTAPALAVGEIGEILPAWSKWGLRKVLRSWLILETWLSLWPLYELFEPRGRSITLWLRKQHQGACSMNR
jgi:hypothetical protein